jgi:hypothetical protein
VYVCKRGWGVEEGDGWVRRGERMRERASEGERGRREIARERGSEGARKGRSEGARKGKSTAERECVCIYI